VRRANAPRHDSSAQADGIECTDDATDDTEDDTTDDAADVAATTAAAADDDDAAAAVAHRSLYRCALNERDVSMCVASNSRE
jgi:hypothetical protein